jgi:hypothetical protein
VNSDLTYRIGGCKDAGSTSDALDLFAYVLDFVFREAAFEIAVELLFTILDLM